MDVKNRKTALDDDSVLYQKRTAEQNKKDVKDLSRKDKVRYFMDYYALKVAIVLIILVIAGNLIYNMCFRNPVTVLSIACIGNVYAEQSEPFSEDLRSLYELTDKDESIYVSNYDLTDYNQQMAFSTHIAVGDTDIVLCDKDQFERYSEQGLFADLTEILDKATLDELSSSILTGKVAEFNDKGEVSSYSAEYPMVIDVTDNTILRQYETYGDPIYLGYCVNSEHSDNIKLFLDYLFHPENYPAIVQE